MRSLIILEVEHGEDTDEFQDACEEIADVLSTYPALECLNYTVKVDLPECFTLETK